MARVPAFLTTLVVTFVLLSALVDKGAGVQRVATGTVSEVYAGDWMLVTNEHMRLPVAVGLTTRYEGNPAAIKLGVRVAVWYRGVGERRFVADKVRVLPEVVRP
jgi:hypothetical protein